MRRSCLVVLWVIFAASSGSEALAKGKSNPAKMRDIQKLTRLMGADKMAQQLVDQLMGALRQSYPNLSEARWKKLGQKANVSQFMQEVAKVYDKYLTHTDIRELISFFESKVGRKFVALQPKLFEESMQIGNRWGERLTNEITQELGQTK